MDEGKKFIAMMLSEPNGHVRVAHVAAGTFKSDPDRTAADLREAVPAELLPDVVFIMASEFVMDGIDPRDETPQARKKIAKRSAILMQYFAKELEEGGTRAAAKMARSHGR